MDQLENVILGAVHKCQHFHEFTNHTLSDTPLPPPPKKDATQGFFVRHNHL